MGNETISYFDCKSLKSLFVDFEPFNQQCQFRDCNHTNQTKGCAVIEAVSQGKISAKRLNSYQQILNNYIFKTPEYQR